MYYGATKLLELQNQDTQSFSSSNAKFQGRPGLDPARGSPTGKNGGGGADTRRQVWGAEELRRTLGGLGEHSGVNMKDTELTCLSRSPAATCPFSPGTVPTLGPS